MESSDEDMEIEAREESSSPVLLKEIKVETGDPYESEPEQYEVETGDPYESESEQYEVETGDPYESEPEQYEVEAIRDKRLTDGRKVEYFVKWKYWPESANTWEPAEHLEGSEELVQAFELEEYMEEYNATVGPTNGFSTERKFVGIQGAVDWGSDRPGELRRNIHYAIKWEDGDNLELIPSSIVRMEKPAEVLAFLESLIKLSK